MCTIQECEEKISSELRYQSSLELSEKTYQALCHIPTAQTLVHESRQQLVARLDDYGRTKMHLLQDVVAHIDEEVIPLLRRCALAGHSVYTTTDPLFAARSQLPPPVAPLVAPRGGVWACASLCARSPSALPADGDGGGHPHRRAQRQRVRRGLPAG